MLRWSYLLSSLTFLLSKMIIMKYFNDIELCSSGIYKNYKGNLKRVLPTKYSVEFIASGKMYFQKLPGKVHIFDSPVLRWQSPKHTYNYGSVDDLGWEHYFITFKGERGKKIYEDGFSRLSKNCFIPIKRVDVFRDLFTKIHNIQTYLGLNNSRAVFHLEEILVTAMEEVIEPAPFSKYIHEFDSLCNNIRSNLQRKFDLKLEAKSIGLSYSHFRKLFNEYTGVPPHQYILRAKMDVAAARIRYTNDPLKQISAGLNLGDTAQFSKAFRKIYGMPPAAYRKLYR